MDVQVSETWRLGVDWAVINTLVGVVFGVLISEWLTRRRERAASRRAMRQLMFEVQTILTVEEECRVNGALQRDILLPNEFEVLHGPAGAEALELLNDLEQTFVGSICRGYELNRRQKSPTPATDELTLVRDVLIARLDVLRSLPRRPRLWLDGNSRRRRLNTDITERREALQAVNAARRAKV